MKVVAAVLTWKPSSNARLGLLTATVSTLSKEADEVVVCDNGSGPDEWIDAGLGMCLSEGLCLGYPLITHNHPCHTSGFGTNFAAREALKLDPDLVVLSDDDIFWRPGWRKALEAWWAEAPDDVVLTGCHIEPIFPWNEIRGVVEHGGMRGLIRSSTGAATWSFRAGDWPKIGPVPSRTQGWNDIPACQKIDRAGLKIAQVDLAEHRGHGQSTWGNLTVQNYGWDVGPAQAILEGRSTLMPEGPIVDVIIPTFGRAQRLAGVVENIREATSRPHVITLVVEGHDHDSVEAGSKIESLPGSEVRLVVNDRSPNYGGAVNCAIATSSTPFWFAGADDLRFYPEWLERALAVADDQFMVIGTNDLLNPFVAQGTHATHYLVDRRYTDEVGGTLDQGPGIALFEGYWHQYVDTEFVGVAKARVRFRPCMNSVVEHLHVSVGKMPADETYERARLNIEQDRQMYEERKRAWFDLAV